MIPRSTLRASLIAASLALAPVAAASVEGGCRVGIYGLTADEAVIVTRSEGGFDIARADGTSGSVGAVEAPVSCTADTLRIGDATPLARRALRETDTVFVSHGVPLAGRLIEPLGADGATPLVVYAHGSEAEGWIDRAVDPYRMVARGVSVFVYDKRGTGASGGRYTQNLPRLADDLVAASEKARALAAGRHGRFGLIGLSQGGWVAPLAANRARAEFVGIGYGLAIDIREEDAAEVRLALRRAGYGPLAIAAAREITDATARIVTEASPEAIAAFGAVRARHDGAPWLPLVRGSYTGLFLDAPQMEIATALLPALQRYEIDWSVDPVAVLREVAAPQLWALAAADRAAPVDETLVRLRALRAEGLDLTVYLFPALDHGMWAFDEAADGTRRRVRVEPAFHDLMADWAWGEIEGPYADAVPQ